MDLKECMWNPTENVDCSHHFSKENLAFRFQSRQKKTQKT